MSVGRLSFWQQDNNWRIQQQQWSDLFSSNTLVTSALTSALTNQAAGLASIANQSALTRVEKELEAAASSALGLSGTSQLSSTSSSLASTQAAASAGASLNLLA